MLTSSIVRNYFSATSTSPPSLVDIGLSYFVAGWPNSNTTRLRLVASIVVRAQLFFRDFYVANHIPLLVGIGDVLEIANHSQHPIDDIIY